MTDVKADHHDSTSEVAADAAAHAPAMTFKLRGVKLPRWRTPLAQSRSTAATAPAALLTHTSHFGRIYLFPVSGNVQRVGRVGFEQPYLACCGADAFVVWEEAVS